MATLARMKMRVAKWHERSLSSWVAIGLVLTVMPLTVSSVLILWLHAHVIGDLDDLTLRYRDQVSRSQHLQLALWEAAAPVEEYLAAQEPALVAAYRKQRVQIEGGFGQLKTALAREPQLRALVDGAQRDWNAADQIATRILAQVGAVNDPRWTRQANEFSALLAAATDKLSAVDDGLAIVVEADRRDASLNNERSKWISGIAIGVSLLLLLLAVALVGRIMIANVERLVEGARRFAEGDRKHRIQVQVPPELRTVASELNRMAAEIQQTEEALAEQARQDPMTGLGNRRAFEEGLKDAYARMHRLREDVVLLMLDVDHFKRINDTYGHAAGDDVLRAIGATLRSTIREVDKAYRVGGEEFVVLLIGTDLTGARVAAERLRGAISATPIATDGHSIQITASIGLAAADTSIPSEEVMRTADRALYAAKTGGRDRVVAASDIN